MNGSALLAEFRDLAQDTTEPYLWDDTFVLGKLNEAEREAADRARLLFDDSTEAVVDIAVTAGAAKHATSPLIIDIVRVFWVVDGESSPLHLYDRHELDRLRDDWRTESDTPTGLVWDGVNVTLDRVPSVDGTIHLEVHRLPSTSFTTSTSPEIPAVHHQELVSWALFRAFSVPDADGANPALAGVYLGRFERYFGRKRGANLRRSQRANKPHVNKAWW